MIQMPESEQIVTIHYAKTHLSRLLRKVVAGEEIIIARGKTPLVKLIPFGDESTDRVIGSAKGQIRIADDFDDPIEDFTSYVG